MLKTQTTTKRGVTGRGRKKPTPTKHGRPAKPSGARNSSRAPTGRPRTKADQILALLQQPSGATLKAITAAIGWQAHSVRGFISGHLIKKMKLRVKSFRRDGERVYAIKS